jgi:ribosomal protein S18 acetylase RimI-like enzyme
MLTYKKASIKDKQAIEDFVKDNVREFAKRFYINPLFGEKTIIEYTVNEILEKMQNGTALWACSESVKKGLSIVTKSDWDSEILGEKIGKLSLYTSLFPAETRQFLQETYLTLRETEFDALFGRVQIESTKGTLRAILADNATLGDLLVTLGKNIYEEESFSEADIARRSDLVFDNGKATDEEQLKKITVSAYRYSHYFNDPNISLKRAEAIYQEWIKNSLKGLVDYVIVARVDKVAVGYITLRIENLGQRAFGIIDLIAVQESYRGQGIAKMLVAEGIRQLHNQAATLYVSTQVSNLPALRVYHALGFEPILTEATFHVWLKSEKKSSETPLLRGLTPAQSLSKAEDALTSRKIKTVVISQPTYLPWLGYFRIMKEADAYVFLDSVQFERRSWQTRNRIKTSTKWTWLTVPTLHENTETLCPIQDVRIDNSKDWRRAHWNAIRTSYGKAPYFKEYSPFFISTYEKQWETLVSLDIHIIKHIASQLGISPIFFKSSELQAEGKRTHLLLNICRMLDANRYVSSIGAKEYMENDGAKKLFDENGIKVDFVTYNEPRYPQLFGDFIPQLSAIDCLFNCGPDSSRIMLDEKCVKFQSIGSN